MITNPSKEGPGSEICDLFSLGLVLFYSLPLGNNTTLTAVYCIISSAHPRLSLLTKEASPLDPDSLLPRTRTEATTRSKL